MTPIVLLIFLGLATFRLTRLAVRDDFPPIRWTRDRLTGKRSPEWLTDLATCHWCASGWISLGLVLGVDLVASVPLPIVMWFASWAIGAVLTDRLG